MVVLGAAGKTFCAGHDLRRCAPTLARLLPEALRAVHAGDAGDQKLPVPVIARVHSIATAAGCQLVAMCDLAVARATRA